MRSQKVPRLPNMVSLPLLYPPGKSNWTASLTF